MHDTNHQQMFLATMEIDGKMLGGEWQSLEQLNFQGITFSKVET